MGLVLLAATAAVLPAPGWRRWTSVSGASNSSPLHCACFCGSGAQGSVRRDPRLLLLRRAHTPHYVDFQDIFTSEPLGTFHASQLTAVAESLASDGVGVIPTDTANAYVTSIASRRGVRRIYDLKGIAPDERKPLSLLCSDLSQASRYADTAAIPKRWFQAMRRLLPGPFTFILRATHEVPRVVLEHKSRKRLWRRREVGIRVPDCAVVHHLARELDMPLLASSADGAISALWSQKSHELDFLVHGMEVSLWDDSHLERVSTIVDLTMEEPVLRRQGFGDASMLVGEDAEPLVQ